MLRVRKLSYLDVRLKLHYPIEVGWAGRRHREEAVAVRVGDGLPIGVGQAGSRLHLEQPLGPSPVQINLRSVERDIRDPDGSVAGGELAGARPAKGGDGLGRHPAIDDLEAGKKAGLRESAANALGEEQGRGPQSVPPVHAAGQRLLAHFYAIHVLEEPPAPWRGQVHCKRNPIPGVWRQRAIELAVGAEAVGVRHRGAVADIELGIVAFVVEGIGLEQRAPLAAAGGGEHNVHEQRVLVDEMSAAVGCGAVAHEETLAD